MAVTGCHHPPVFPLPCKTRAALSSRRTSAMSTLLLLAHSLVNVESIFSCCSAQSKHPVFFTFSFFFFFTRCCLLLIIEEYAKLEDHMTHIYTEVLTAGTNKGWCLIILNSFRHSEFNDPWLGVSLQFQTAYFYRKVSSLYVCLCVIVCVHACVANKGM